MTFLRRIVVVGMGYVGFPLAVMLARAGHRVIGVDRDDNVIEAVNRGLLNLSEDDIQEIFAEPEVRANLGAQEEPSSADAFVISVPTPLRVEKRVADLTQVENALSSILPYLEPQNLLVLESTVPPLTCRNLIRPAVESAGFTVGKDIFVAHCPERILPGNVFQEIVFNDRIVGGMDPQSTTMAADLYSSFVKGRIFETNDVTAELVKLMENASRDVNIALANEFALVAENLGIDIVEAIDLANQHPRVDILRPGIGTGGHCIPVDPWFIKEVDPVNTRLIHTARSINDEIPTTIAGRVRQELSGLPEPKIVAIGLAYKPNTYDTRNSPAGEVIGILRRDGYAIQEYDQHVPGYDYSSLMEVARGADCLLVLVEHPEVVKELDENLEDISDAMATPKILRFYA